jgi:glycerate-2-kinase
MIIKKLDKLATNKIRKDALDIVEAGYESISIASLIGKDLSFEQNILSIEDKKYDFKKFKNIFVVAIGKGSGLIAQKLESLIGPESIRSGVAIDLKHRKLKKIKVFAGTHPLPSERNILATKKLIKTLGEAKAKDLVIAIVCGGGSSLACLPAKNNTCTDLRTVSNHMLKNGATIQELNIVRKHISSIHGGNMAKYAYPASVLGLIISDVPGNDIDIVASGPISKDESSLGQAKEIANKFDLLNIKLSETPKDDKYFKKVSKVTLASGSTALEAMSKKAKEIGYNPVIYSDNLSGLASEIGPKMAGSVKKGQALLACGETTVIVKKPGKGGRNQDLALSALPFLKPQSAMVSAASDGKDNIDIAGAITDTESLKLKNNNATEAVEDNQSFKTLKSINGVFNINKITANVSDFIVVLREG